MLFKTAKGLNRRWCWGVVPAFASPPEPLEPLPIGSCCNRHQALPRHGWGGAVTRHCSSRNGPAGNSFILRFQKMMVPPKSCKLEDFALKSVLGIPHFKKPPYVVYRFKPIYESMKVSTASCKIPSFSVPRICVGRHIHLKTWAG